MTFAIWKEITETSFLKKKSFFKEATHVLPHPQDRKAAQARAKGRHVHHAASWGNEGGLLPSPPSAWRRSCGLAVGSPAPAEPWILEGGALALPGGDGGS